MKRVERNEKKRMNIEHEEVQLHRRELHRQLHRQLPTQQRNCCHTDTHTRRQHIA